jgi:preprotein translocase subunit SecB
MSILQLEDYFLTRLHVDFNFPKEEEVHVEELSIDFDYESLTHQDDPLRRLLTLRIRAGELTGDGEQVAHQFECEINGQFRIPEHIPKEHHEGLVCINGTSILYSTLRGIIGNLSGSFPSGRLCLPTINPEEVVKRVQKAKSSAAKKKAKLKKKAVKRK